MICPEHHLLILSLTHTHTHAHTHTHLLLPPDRFRNMYEMANHVAKQEAQNDSDPAAEVSRRRGQQAAPLLPSLVWDLTRSQLLEQSLADDLVQFSMITVGVSCWWGAL